MSAVLKTDVSRRPYASRSSLHSRGTSNYQMPMRRSPSNLAVSPSQLVALPTPQQPVVKPFPNAQPVPAWLRVLIGMQRGSSIVTFVLLAAVMGMYSITVYTQHLWTKGYHRLDELQHQERQQTAMNEALKNQIARQAEDPSVGLVLPDSSNTIFLQPAPVRSVAPPSATPTPNLIKTAPLGY